MPRKTIIIGDADSLGTMHDLKLRWSSQATFSITSVPGDGKAVGDGTK